MGLDLREWEYICHFDLKFKDVHTHPLVYQVEQQLSHLLDVLFALRYDIIPTERPTLQSPRAELKVMWGCNLPTAPLGHLRATETQMDTGAALPGNWSLARNTVWTEKLRKQLITHRDTLTENVQRGSLAS